MNALFPHKSILATHLKEKRKSHQNNMQKKVFEQYTNSFERDHEQTT